MYALHRSNKKSANTYCLCTKICGIYILDGIAAIFSPTNKKSAPIKRSAWLMMNETELFMMHDIMKLCNQGGGTSSVVVVVLSSHNKKPDAPSSVSIPLCTNNPTFDPRPILPCGHRLLLLQALTPRRKGIYCTKMKWIAHGQARG